MFKITALQIRYLCARMKINFIIYCLHAGVSLIFLSCSLVDDATCKQVLDALHYMQSKKQFVHDMKQEIE